ncbi:MAG: sigma-70 family RNA polymerase sigma factor [Armatimonadota bacterium]
MENTKEEQQSGSSVEQDTAAQFRAFRETRDPLLRDQLVCYHLHLVHSVARRFLGLGESLDDLIQEGSIGLLNAVDLYDPDRGVKFSTYACHLILGQIQHYLRDRGRLIRQPAWVQELNTKVTRTTELLFQEFGRDPLPSEVADRLKLTEEAVQNVLAARELNRIMSLSAPADNSGENDLSIIDKEQLPAAKLAAMQLPIEDRIVLDEAIDNLKPLEQQVIRLFFFGDLNQSEIARKLGISVNYSSYLLRRSVMKIKTVIEEQRSKETEAMLDEEILPTPSATFVQIHDPLTGLYSGAYLRTRVAEEIARSRRYPTNFALMLIALHGLTAGVTEQQPFLEAAGRSLRGSVRTIDLLGYQGNARFALLLPHTGREARVLGERLCRPAFLQQGIFSNYSSQITMNIGFAVFPMDGASEAMLFDRAEQALSHAVTAGPGAVASLNAVWLPGAAKV